MSVGKDAQYDLTWEEQDKINRRRAIRTKLKAEFVRNAYDPFNQIQGKITVDPAVQRFIAMRKVGRIPGSPLPFRIFGAWMSMVLLPVLGYGLFYKYRSEERDRRINAGEMPDEERGWLTWQ